jgi:lipopolysaccharide export system protein LptC
MDRRTCMRPSLLFAAALATVLASGCLPGRPGEAGQLVPELTMEGVRFSVERGGVTRATGEAARLVYRRDTTALLAEGLTLDLLSPDGPVKVTAPRGVGVATDRRFDVEGGLRATRGADVATTASARYESPPGGPALVSGAEPVTVVGPGYRLTGKGFRLLPPSGEIVIGGGARLVAGLPVTP